MDRPGSRSGRLFNEDEVWYLISEVTHVLVALRSSLQHVVVFTTYREMNLMVIWVPDRIRILKLILDRYLRVILCNL